jgi:hypothetical protein
MAIKYASTPQLHYGSPSRFDRTISKIPRGAQPMHTAPVNVSIAVMGDDGKSHWALRHRDSWQKLRPHKDSKDGSVRWMMCGESISNPIAWWIPERKR